MGQLTRQTYTPGTPIVYDTPDVNGDEFENDGNVQLWVDASAAGTDRTITISGRQRCDQGFLHDSVFTVQAGGEVILPMLPPRRYNLKGKSFVQLDDVTDMKIAAVFIPPKPPQGT